MYTICAKDDSSLLRRSSQKDMRRLSIVTWSGSLSTSPYTMQLGVDGLRCKILKNIFPVKYFQHILRWSPTPHISLPYSIIGNTSFSNKLHWISIGNSNFFSLTSKAKCALRPLSSCFLMFL